MKRETNQHDSQMKLPGDHDTLLVRTVDLRKSNFRTWNDVLEHLAKVRLVSLMCVVS